MKASRVVLGAAAGAAGVVAAGATAKLIQHRRISHDDGEQVALGSLRSDPITVVADDGVPLHVEIDEPLEDGDRQQVGPLATLVFVHGYALNLDVWHFQRATYRGRIRAIYYDQRSHGRSGHSSSEHDTIDQLGRDLARVLDDLTGDEPVIVLGHSMGGMTLLSLAEQRPELFGTKIVGAALISTTAGGLDTGRILFPMLPAGIGPGLITRVVDVLSRGSAVVDRMRGYGKEVALFFTDLYSFGTEVPRSYVDFVYEMHDSTPFSVVADFFPAFASLDSWTHLEPFSRVPTAVICGTGDKITGVTHSREMHAKIAGSDLLEIPDAGHLVIMESHEQVGPELDSLISRVSDQLADAGGRQAGVR